MDFDLIQPEDVIDPAWLVEYELQRKHIWLDQVVRLNTDLFILDKIDHFPWQLFLINMPLFWSEITISLYESCILLIYKMVVDKDKKALTIKRFKNRIRQHTLSLDLQKELDRSLRAVGFDKNIERLEGRVLALRSGRIAHYDMEYNAGLDSPKFNKDALNMDELFEITKEINQLFNFLCFSKGRSVNFMEYSKKGTDIEILLDDIALKSDVLNMPKQQPELWRHYRNGLSKQEIASLNFYRAKFNLPIA